MTVYSSLLCSLANFSAYPSAPCPSSQDDFKGVAVALVQMGATNSNVNIDKFASELGAVVKKITSLQPQVRSPYSTSYFSVNCTIVVYTVRTIIYST
jgi:hypothetical protein